jgi:hypothetical protein
MFKASAIKFLGSVDQILGKLVWLWMILVDVLAVKACIESGLIHNLQHVVLVALANALVIWVKINPKAL